MRDGFLPNIRLSYKAFVGWTRFRNGNLYTGEVDEKGNPHGVGIVIVHNESISYSTFDHSLMNGETLGIYFDGVREQGFQERGLRHGKHVFS